MLSEMVIKKTTLKGNKKVPAGFYVLNIPLIIIKRIYFTEAKMTCFTVQLK